MAKQQIDHLHGAAKHSGINPLSAITIRDARFLELELFTKSSAAANSPRGTGTHLDLRVRPVGHLSHDKAKPFSLS